jgi:agmatinase
MSTIVNSPNPAENPRFCGISTFARLPLKSQVKDFDVAVVGVPFDSGCTFRNGARFGPEAIRKASRLIRQYNIGQETYPFQRQQCVDAGDIICNPCNIDKAVREIYSGAADLLKECKHICVLGGDHTLSYPILKAVSEKYGPVALVHFDSHFDTWDEYFGEGLTHGTPFRRAQEQGYVDTSHSIHVGIRGSIHDHVDIEKDAELGYKTIFCDEIDRIGVEGVIEKVRKRVGDTPIYLSIDIDVVDPAFAPGTGTPEPGGFSSRELFQMIRGLKGLSVVGGDIVEVSPAYDHADITAQLASNVTFEMMSLLHCDDQVSGSPIDSDPDKNTTSQPQ